MRKIKKDDEVIVIAGKSKGTRGTVTRLIDDGARVFVQGANMVKKHVKPDPNRNIEGGIREQEAALRISNVALYNPLTNKADRVGFKILEDGRKVRYFKSNGEVVDI